MRKREVAARTGQKGLEGSGDDGSEGDAWDKGSKQEGGGVVPKA